MSAAHKREKCFKHFMIRLHLFLKEKLLFIGYNSVRIIISTSDNFSIG